MPSPGLIAARIGIPKGFNLGRYDCFLLPSRSWTIKLLSENRFIFRSLYQIHRFPRPTHAYNTFRNYKYTQLFLTAMPSPKNQNGTRSHAGRSSQHTYHSTSSHVSSRSAREGCTDGGQDKANWRESTSVNVAAVATCPTSTMTVVLTATIFVTITAASIGPRHKLLLHLLDLNT